MSKQEQFGEEITFEQRLQYLKMLQGLNGNGEQNDPDPDEEYAVFTDGPHADQFFRRVARASVGVRRQVDELRIKVKNSIIDHEFKKMICDEMGWDESKCSEELSKIDFYKKLLPLITREELPKGWKIDHVSSYEVQRMLKDFLLGT